MSDDVLQQAYTRVRSRYNDEAWFALPPRSITDAIYREMRQIDAERLDSVRAEPSTGKISSAA